MLLYLEIKVEVSPIPLNSIFNPNLIAGLAFNIGYQKSLEEANCIALFTSSTCGHCKTNHFAKLSFQPVLLDFTLFGF